MKIATSWYATLNQRLLKAALAVCSPKLFLPLQFLAFGAGIGIRRAFEEPARLLECILNCWRTNFALVTLNSRRKQSKMYPSYILQVSNISIQIKTLQQCCILHIIVSFFSQKSKLCNNLNPSCRLAHSDFSQLKIVKNGSKPN